MIEWDSNNKFNSFNSSKGLTYYEHYKKIVSWLNRKTDYLPAPVEVALDPNANCNNKCYFCVNQRYLRHHPDDAGHMRSLPADYLHRLVSFMADWGARGICISGGGEPTLLKATHSLPSLIHLRGMDSAFATNLTVMTEELAENLMLCRWVGISVNSANKNTYIKVTGKDNFDDVIANIYTLTTLRQKIKAKVDLCYKLLLLPENMGELYDACKLAKSLGVQDFHIRPADLERKDMLDANKLDFDTKYIKEQFEKCHEEETENFHVYTVVHKFDENFHVVHNFNNCLATPLVIPILSDGNSYVCIDKKMDSLFKLGSCYPNPEQILSWWGKEAHRKLLENINISNCSRCTWCQYNAQIENVVLKDSMCLSFP